MLKLSTVVVSPVMLQWSCMKGDVPQMLLELLSKRFLKIRQIFITVHPVELVTVYHLIFGNGIGSHQEVFDGLPSFEAPLNPMFVTCILNFDLGL